MSSEDESQQSRQKKPLPKQRLLPKLKDPKRTTSRNRITIPEVHSYTQSDDTSDKTSIEMDVFLARGKTNKPRKRFTSNTTSDDLSETSNLNTVSDNLMITETSEEKPQPRSYRDRIKERFRTVKQKSTQSLEKSSLRKFKQRSQDVMSLNKCIEALKNDNYNIDVQLRAHRAYEYVGGNGVVSSAEKYQFFCESLPEQWNQSIHRDDDDEHRKNGGEKIEEKQQEIVVKRAEDIKELIKQSYEELTWIPKKKDLIFQAEKTLRNLQDEGLFTTNPPKMRANDYFLLEQRLLASENKEWLNTSGKLNFEQSNYTTKTYRPHGFDDPNPFDLTYAKPTRYLHDSMTSITIAESTAILDVHIQSVRLTNHHLFSEEHKLQEKLIQHFDKHKEFIRSNKRSKLADRLHTLRASKDEADKLRLASGEVQDEKEDQKEDEGIIKQIKTLRDEYYSECRLYRENVKDVLNAWKDLKKQRKEQSYSSTQFKLVINKQVKSHCDDFERVYSEVSEEKEIEFLNRLKQYKKDLLKWNRREEKDDIRETEMEKPLRPSRMSARKLRTDLETNLEAAFGSSDEPMLTFSVNYSNVITPAAELNNEVEKQRRTSLMSKKMYLKLFWDELPICKTKPIKLTDTFTLNFDEDLSIKLRVGQHQNKITMKLIEKHATNKESLCNFSINIPPQNQHFSKNSFEELAFLANSENRPHIITSGFLTFSLGWNLNNDGTDPNTEMKTNNIDLINSDGTLNVAKLENWIDTNHPNPEDPRNTIIFDYLQEQQNVPHAKQAHKYFRTDPFLEVFTIATREVIDENIRLQLLTLRDRNEPEFVGMMVPNRIKEIPSNIFSTYRRRLAEERYQEYFDDEDSIDDDIIVKRSMGRKYLRQIHTRIFQLCRNCDNNLSYEDVVDEKMIVWFQSYLTTLLYNFLNWFRITPKINKPLPLREATQQDTALVVDDNASGQTILIVQLKSGHNLPVHNATKPSDTATKRKVGISAKTRGVGGDVDTSESDAQGGKYYVEFVYGNTSARSALSGGKHNPTWNETMSICLQSASVDYLNQNALNGIVRMNLFQQVDDESEGHFLGSVEVPISAAVTDNKLEGFFPLKLAAFIYGFEKEEEVRLPSTPRVQPTKRLSFLEMCLYTEPCVPKMSADMANFTSSEPPYLRDHILEWNRRFNLDHQKRKFNAMVMDANGKTVCVTRFIKPLEAPQLNADGFDVTAEQCARYVSLIPFSDANKFYQNIWLTAEQMLKLKIGSLIDHATLLTCYLLSLNLDVWLLLGFGIPHGQCAYVLQREYVSEATLPNHYVIDVTNGNRFDILDVHCPLKKIYCVVNNSNVWANVQRGDAVFTTRFDFTRRFDWQPLFNNSISAPSNTIQHKIHYINAGNAATLQTAIEKKLHKKIAKLRTQDVTIWNHYVSNLLRQQLNKVEKNFMHNKTHVSLSRELLEFSANCKVSGVIQYLPFSSINEVIDFVLQMKSWEIIGGNVEFASAVQTHVYANQIIAVWIAFITIKKNN